MLLPMPNPNVVYKAVTEGAVLLSTEDEIYYGLNAVGAWIWERLPPVLIELDDLCNELSSLHPEADADTIHADVRALLDDLASYALVQFPQQHRGQATDEPQAFAQTARAQASRVG